jgi:CheY-like chemotaxis protein
LIPAYAGGNRRVSVRAALILEDDRINRDLFRAVMERVGFTTLMAATAEEAHREAERFRDPIALLIADIILKEEDGAKCARSLLKRRPEMAVLFVSGTPLEELQQRAVLDRGIFNSRRIQFLQKPFSVRKLLDTISEMVPGGRPVRIPVPSPGL